MIKRRRSDDQAKKMPQLKRQSSKENARSPMLKKDLNEYEPYADFLVNGHSSNPQRPSQLGQFVRNLDAVLGNAGRGENKTGGKSLAVLLCLVLLLRKF